MSKNYTIEEFIIKAKITHGNKYDYSLVDYRNNNFAKENDINLIRIKYTEINNINNILDKNIKTWQMTLQPIL